MTLDTLALGLGIGIVSGAVGFGLVALDDALWRRKWRHRREDVGDE